MKRLWQPFMNAVHNQLEGMKNYRPPRAASKKVRRYEQVDLTREFEIRVKRREQEKQKRLNELYEKHDKRAAEIRSVMPAGGQSDLSEGEAITTDDGEEGGEMSKRKMAMQVQE